MYETVWSFETARFTVNLGVAPEDLNPAGNFDDPRDVEFANNGGWHWFQARVQVVFRDTANPKNWAVQRDVVLGADYLGGCSYHGLTDFKAGGYFRDMVRSAVEEARAKLVRASVGIRVTI